MGSPLHYAQVFPANPACPETPRQICCSCAFPTADSSLQSPTQLGSWQGKGGEVLCVDTYGLLVLFDSIALVGSTGYHLKTFWTMVSVPTDLERGKRYVFMQWYLSIHPQIFLCLFLLCLLSACSCPRTAAQSRLWGGLHSEFFAGQLASSKVYFVCLYLSSWACCGQWWRKGQCGESSGKEDRSVVQCRSEAINAAFLQASLMWNDGCCCSWLQESYFVCTVSPCHKIPTARSPSWWFWILFSLLPSSERRTKFSPLSLWTLNVTSPRHSLHPLLLCLLPIMALNYKSCRLCFCSPPCVCC